MPGDLVKLISEDSVIDDTIQDGLRLPIEHLNRQNPSELPPHELLLKKDCIVMLIRNLDVDEGLCNGTRLRIKEIHPHMLKCEILTGIL